MIDDKNYVRISYFTFANDFDKKSVERICNLEYKIGEIIKITGTYNNDDE